MPADPADRRRPQTGAGMPLTRVYLPLTPADLTGLAEGRPLGPAPRHAHAVTPALGKPGLVTDEEELEHAAWVAATEEAIAAPGDGPRGGASSRPPTSTPPSWCTRPRPTCPRGSRSSAPVERRRIVSFHVDEEPGVHRADRPALVRRHRARRRARPRRPALTRAGLPPRPRQPGAAACVARSRGARVGVIPTSRPETRSPTAWTL